MPDRRPVPTTPRPPLTSRAPLTPDTAPVLANQAEKDWLGNLSHTGGLTDRPAEFVALMHKAAVDLDVRPMIVIRDYGLTRCLHSISVETGGDGRLFRDHPNAALANMVCSFGGGTALVSAWGVSERISEDLDLLCLMSLDASPTALKRPHTAVSKIVASACGVTKKELDINHQGTIRFRQTWARIGAARIPLKVESAVEPDDDSLFEPRKVMSLMGRFATPAQLAQFPELGGFEMPCIVPAYTAANKLDALHRRAANVDNPRLVVSRVRDVYDLAKLAQSAHADAVRSRLPSLAVRASVSTGTRKEVPRPSGGYAESPVFHPGSVPYEALREVYDPLLSDDVWEEQPPSFEEAAELAAGLDRG